MWGRFQIKELEKMHREPSPASFGITIAVVLTIIFAFAQKWSMLGIPAAFLFLALLRPRLLRPLNRAWYIFGLFLGWLMSPLFLALFYFVVFVPMVLVIKLFGHKPFPKKGWVVKTKPCNFTRNF